LLIEEPSAKKEKNKNLHQKVIEFLFSKRNITEEQINAYIKDGNKFEISCCEFFIKASKKLTNPKIKKYLKEADSIKKLIELNMAFDAFYENKNAFIKRNILAEFPINSVFLTDDLNQRIYDLVVKKLKQVEPSSYSNSNGKKLIKSYVQLKKTSVKLNEINAVAYRVLSHNPKKFP
jgi:hypothetical protein